MVDVGDDGFENDHRFSTAASEVRVVPLVGQMGVATVPAFEPVESVSGDPRTTAL